jgi:hypothetical protein
MDLTISVVKESLSKGFNIFREGCRNLLADHGALACLPILSMWQTRAFL